MYSTFLANKDGTRNSVAKSDILGRAKQQNSVGMGPADLFQQQHLRIFTLYRQAHSQNYRETHSQARVN